ncbi:MAG: hypothetical protein RL337_635 [Bacteroidota bacterium]
MQKIGTLFVTLFFILSAYSQQSELPYWNRNTQLIPWRLVPSISNCIHIDLDKDGNPDILKAFLNDSIPILWIDDDDDMKWEDKEGDTDNDCLLIDKNKDGVFAGPFDFSIDWIDEDHDGKADIQLIVNNAGTKVRNYFDWGADFMYVLDVDKDQIMHYVDWNKIMMRAWEHYGHANFYKDYSGNSTFLKMHASSFRISDLRFNWENPFIFYDTDKDGLTEWAIRLVDTPVFRDSANNKKNGFNLIDSSLDVQFTKKIDYAAVTWDLDNDNSAGNEFDFDMSLLFKGKGFSYEDQGHQFKGLRGLAAANSFMYDSRWRNIDTLFYPDRDTAYQMIFKKGDWQQCRLVFDEDDDCNRWERVEFYDPLDFWKTGIEGGGLDNNGQSDAVGDRGEFDMDNSGKGKLYIGAFDGRIHLYGAEWGGWRIDQTAFSYQGFGGFYEKWNRKRLQLMPEKFASVKYEDSDGNGFIDQILYDLDGDHLFEDSVSLIKLKIPDQSKIIESSNMNYGSFSSLFRDITEKNWSRALLAIEVAEKYKINTTWYSFYKQPHSLHEKYDYSFWLNYYIYQDIRYQARISNDFKLLEIVDKAYYSGDWGRLIDY